MYQIILAAEWMWTGTNGSMETFQARTASGQNHDCRQYGKIMAFQ